MSERNEYVDMFVAGAVTAAGAAFFYFLVSLFRRERSEKALGEGSEMEDLMIAAVAAEEE